MLNTPSYTCSGSYCICQTVNVNQLREQLTFENYKASTMLGQAQHDKEKHMSYGPERS